MAKTGQFTTKCKGDIFIALERQIGLWQDSTLGPLHLVVYWPVLFAVIASTVWAKRKLNDS